MPVAGHGNFCSRSPTEKWQMLLYQDGDEGNIHLLMPMSQKGDCWLSPEQGNRIRFHHTSNMGANLLIATTTIKHNFTQIIRFSLDYFKKLILQENLNMETFKSTEHHANDSIFLDKLGYCTWNAFGKEIKIENLYKAVDSLKIHDIPIGYLLLDDGWQCISNTNKLVNLDACSNKFPGGLKNSISQLRRLYPRIQHIGVWHVSNETSCYYFQVFILITNLYSIRYYGVIGMESMNRWLINLDPIGLHIKLNPVTVQ